VRGRQSVWSNPKVQQRLKRFVTCADEVHYLHKRAGRECDFFRGFSEQGHYGKNGPQATRQGIYCASPSGRFLGSVNSNDPGRVIAMLDAAWAAWNKLPKKQRYLDPAPTDTATGRGRRGEPLYPADGLACRIYVRDLPRPKQAPARDWRGSAWNTDTVWFRKAEARAFLPAECKVGAQHDVPRALVERLARFCFIDSVRGQTAAYESKQIEQARLRVTVTKREGSKVFVRFEGATHAKAGARSVQGEIEGVAGFDLTKGRFEEFQMTLRGTRRNGTRFNFRQGDPGPAPIGFALALADPADRTAPAFWWRYWS